MARRCLLLALGTGLIMGALCLAARSAPCLRQCQHCTYIIDASAFDVGSRYVPFQAHDEWNTAATAPILATTTLVSDGYTHDECNWDCNVYHANSQMEGTCSDEATEHFVVLRNKCIDQSS